MWYQRARAWWRRVQASQWAMNEGGHDQDDVPLDRGVEPGLALVEAEAVFPEALSDTANMLYRAVDDALAGVPDHIPGT